MKMYDEKIERAALGSMLLSKEALYNSIEILLPNDFYDIRHQIIYQTIQGLFNNEKKVDYLMVMNKITENKLSNKVSEKYIIDTMASVPNKENIDYYNNIIKTKSNQRKIFKILEELKNNKIEIEEGLLKIESLSKNEIKDDTFSTILEHTLRDSVQGVKHKFKIGTLNHYLGGVDEGEIITIGGWTSQGKSTLGLQLAIDFASVGKKILILSTEMSEIEIARRILSNQNKKNIMDFRKGVFKKGEKEAFQSIINIISKISGKWEVNIKKIYNMTDVVKYIRKYSPEIIFIDYLQNMSGDSRLSDYQRMTHNIKELQSLALREKVTIFVLSQLSRDKEIRKPKLSDLRDSGRIEECSNIVIFLYWEDRLKEKNKQRRGGEPPEELEIRIGKNRDGTIGKMFLDFYPEYCRIEDKEQNYDNN